MTLGQDAIEVVEIRRPAGHVLTLLRHARHDVERIGDGVGHDFDVRTDPRVGHTEAVRSGQVVGQFTDERFDRVLRRPARGEWRHFAYAELKDPGSYFRLPVRANDLSLATRNVKDFEDFAEYEGLRIP